MSGKANLNPEQAAAVRHIQGPQLILAGAGSGKTTVITNRIANMVKQGIPPSSIVAVTFTNKSAREMKARLSKMLKRDKMRGMVVSTFHSLGNRILQKEITHLDGYHLPFSILSPDDLQNIMADIYRALKLDPARVREDGILFTLSLFKNSGISAERFAEERLQDVLLDIFPRIANRYQQALLSMNAVDFDDLILLPQRIFKEFPEVLERYQRRWRNFMIDEYQDTNPAQYEFLRTLVGSDHNICVVGDDDQSIYGWRGADINIILGFERDFQGAHVVRLETNYRSTEEILHAANVVIARNSNRVKKKLRSVNGSGAPLRGIVGFDEVREASLVADDIRDLMIRGKFNPGDFAILFRTNFQSRAFEQELRNRNIPHHVVGGYRFFDRREVRDMIGYLRVLANPRDEIALTRVINRPRRGIGEGSINKLMQFILDQPDDKQNDLHTLLERLITEPHLVPGLRQDAVHAIYEFMGFISDYRSKFSKARRLSPIFAQMIKDLDFEMEFRREGDNENTARARMLNLSELVNMLSFMEDNWDESQPPTIFDFLARLSMMATDQDDESPRGRVQLLTLHLSKGLEFPVVYLTGMEEGLFPAPRTLEENGAEALSEERRLFYVGITRARRQLVLTRAANRRKFGESNLVLASRFLEELPPDSVQWDITEETEDAEPAGQNTLTGLLDSL